MSIELIEAILSLEMVLDEENARLQEAGYDPLLAGLVAAKIRLVGIIEAENVRLGGDDRDWRTELDDDAHAALRESIGSLFDKLDLNQHLLNRRMAICDDLLGAITTEAKRAAGGRSIVYGKKGALTHADQATPIAVNSKY
ncbi:hypothetical protein ACT009_03890 [Sphingomonas sp. Tas61C01]|uniref:hypothetical protein n=1 Tax=Sphingomonas sp. Tas61C01 TaxID=3458297 RepID=UPI00403ED388